MSNFYLKKCNCVFIHIPKTGGLSIRQGMFKGEYEGPFLGIIPPQYDKLFKFCFVRNPYDRIISAWKYYQQRFKSSISLKEFILIAVDDTITYTSKNNMDENGGWDLSKFDTYKTFLRHHSIPQTHPFNCLYKADFIGRFENINEDMAKICDQLNMEAKLPHRNKTKRGHYRDYFDIESRWLVDKWYREDIERLGYTF